MTSRMQLALITFAVCLPTLAHAQQTLAAADVILEDSFEKGGKAPDGWKSGATIAGVNYVYDKKNGSAGKRSLSLQKSAQRYFPIAQWFRTLPAPKSQSIDVTAKVRAKGTTKAIMEVQFLNQAGRMIGKKWVAYIGAKKTTDKPVSHDWKEYGDTADIPPNTKNIRIGLQIYGPGQVWFDDLKITTGKAHRNSGSAGPAEGPGTSATTIKVNGADAQYIYASSRARHKTKPAGLLIVLPGGSGSAEFHPFVSRIHENTTGGDVVLAQPIAKNWTTTQTIVWPTATNKVKGMKYSTEELIVAVVEDVEKKQKLDRNRIFLLAWSSSGPAAYAAMLQKESVLSGGLIAMSVFKPKTLPPLTEARNRRFYLLHSPQDPVCPYWMVEQAKGQLAANGGHVTLVDYAGGHGWRGDVFGNISAGLKWLAEKP